MPAERPSIPRAIGLFAVIALVALPFADLHIEGHDPWPTLARMAAGMATPDFSAIEAIFRAIWLTVAFAVAGVGLGAGAGLVLAPLYHKPWVRLPAIAIRSVHELFWALMLMQVMGVTPLTGVLAIALPYTGIFAKVFAETIEETDPRPARALGRGADAVSRFAFARAPMAARAMRTYTLYRLECGLRSSAVLGFIGLPTLGFQLDSFFRLGDYSAASAVLICYVALIASIRIWMRNALAPLWLLASVITLARLPHPPMGDGALWRFLSNDIVPAPLRSGWDGPALAAWIADLAATAIWPGIVATIIVTQIALVVTGAIALASFGATVPRIAGRVPAALGRFGLVVLRSLPEYMLAYLFLQAFGPSMVPAILALGLHNGAIIAHLLGRDSMTVIETLRRDAPHGLSLWGYEVLPRLSGPFLALCLYRWEIILRESAVMGLLGIVTLGFFIDSAVAELRLDRAVVLLITTGLLTWATDTASRAIRSKVGPDIAPGAAGGKAGTSVL